MFQIVLAGNYQIIIEISKRSADWNIEREFSFIKILWFCHDDDYDRDDYDDDDESWMMAMMMMVIKAA